MIRFGGLMLALLLVAQGRPATGKVNSTFDKSVDFKTFQTYGWIAGQNAFDPAAHKTIVSAIDAEMAALGLKKVEGRAGQVTVRYLAVRSTSVGSPAFRSRSYAYSVRWIGRGPLGPSSPKK